MQTSKEGLTIEQRLIPKEPSYLIINLAMSDNAWAKVDQNLTYPGVTFDRRCRWSYIPVLSMCGLLAGRGFAGPNPVELCRADAHAVLQFGMPDSCSCACVCLHT